MNKFVVGRDGFIDFDYPLTFEEAKERWDKTITNTLLYQYDVSVYEIDEAKKIVRRVSYQELTS
jgi:hypothetical protein